MFSVNCWTWFFKLLVSTIFFKAQFEFLTHICVQSLWEWAWCVFVAFEDTFNRNTMQPLFSVNIASITVSNSNYCASYHVLCIENRMIILVLWKLQGAFHKRSLWRVLTKWDVCHIKNWVSHTIGKKIYYASDSHIPVDHSEPTRPRSVRWRGPRGQWGSRSARQIQPGTCWQLRQKRAQTHWRHTAD